MDFENIVVIIAIIWYIVSLLKKKKPKPKTAAKSQKDAQAKQGIMSHLGNKIKEAVKELERQAAESQQQKAKAGSGDSSGEWDRFREKDEELQWEAEDNFEDEDREDAFTRPRRAVKVAATPPDADQRKPGTAVTAISTSPDAPSFTPEILRNAVVWSEILAPPLALREERGDVRSMPD